MASLLDVINALAQSQVAMPGGSEVQKLPSAPAPTGTPQAAPQASSPSFIQSAIAGMRGPQSVATNPNYPTKPNTGILAPTATTSAPRTSSAPATPPSIAPPPSKVGAPPPTQPPPPTSDSLSVSRSTTGGGEGYSASPLGIDPTQITKMVSAKGGINAQEEQQVTQQAQQIGEELGAVLGSQEVMLQHQQLMQEEGAKYNAMSRAMRYPGLDADLAIQLEGYVAKAMDPSATEDDKKMAVAAQQRLSAAQEMPSTEPQGWQKFANTIAIAMGAFGATLGRTPNYAMEYVNAEIQREVDRQERDWKRRGAAVDAQANIYARAREQFNDDITARRATEAMLYGKLGRNFEKMKWAVDFTQEEAKRKDDASFRSATLRQQAQQDRMQMAAKTGGIELKLPEAERKILRETAAAMGTLTQLEKEFEDINPAEGLLGVGGTYTKAGRYNARVKAAARMMFKNLIESGAVDVKSAEIMEKQLATAIGSKEGGRIMFKNVSQMMLDRARSTISSSALSGNPPEVVNAIFQAMVQNAKANPQQLLANPDEE